MGYDIGPKIGIEGEAEFRNAIKEINAGLKTLDTQMKVVTSSYGANDKSVDKLTARQKVLNQQIDLQMKKLLSAREGLQQAKEKYGENSVVTQGWQQQVNKATEQLNNLDRELQENDRALEEAKRATTEEAKAEQAAAKATEQLARAHEQASKQIAELSEKLQRNAQTVRSINQAALAAGAAIAGIGLASIKVGANFEASMSNVSALSGATGEELKELGDKAKELGASTSKTASEAADALGYMALAGWDNEQMLTGLEPILRLSEAAGADLATTSDLVTDSMSALGVQTEDLSRYLDIVAKTQSSANTSAQGMLEAYIGCGGTMRDLGVSLEESASWIGVLANRGIKASEAGTSFNSIMVNLTGGAGKASEAMETLGISAWDSNGDFIGVEGTLRLLADSLKSCTKEQKTLFKSAIGGKTQMDTLQALLSGLDEEYADLKDGITNCDGALVQTAKTMQDNLKGKLTALGSAAEGVGIAFYEKLQVPASNAVAALTEKIGAFGQALANGELDNSFNVLAAGAATAVTAIVGLNAVLVAKDMLNFISAARLGVDEVIRFTAATKAGAAAQSAFNLVQALSPMGALAIAASAAAMGLAVYLNKTGAAETETQRFSKYVDELGDKLDEYKSKQEELERSRDEALSGSMAELNHVQSMAKELDNLTDKTGKVNEKDKDRARTLTNLINEIMPGTVEWIEKEGEAYATTTDNLDDLIKKEQIKAWLDADAESYQAAIKNRETLMNDIAQTTQKIEDEKRKLADLKAQQQNVMGTANDTVKYEQLQQEIDGVTAEIEKASNKLQGYDEQLSNALTVMQRHESVMAADISGDMDQINAALEENGMNLQTYTGNNLALLQQQARDADEYYAHMLEKAKREPKLVTQVMLDEARERAEKAKEIASQGGIEEVQAFANGGSSQIGFVQAATYAITQAALAKLDEARPKALESGQFFTQGFINGIKNNMDVVRETAAKFAGTAVSAVQTTIKQGSPSRVMLESGLWFDAGFEKGIEDGTSDVEKAAREMSKKVLSAATQWVADQKFYNKLSVKDETEFWTKMKNVAGLKAEELAEIDKKLYTSRINESKAAYDETKKWIDEQKFYNRMSAQEELAEWHRVVDQKNLQVAEQLEAQRQLFTAQQAVLEENRKKTEEIMEANAKAVEQYRTALESRISSLESFAGLFSKIEKDNKVTGETLKKNLQDQVQAFKGWQQDMQTLAAKGVTGELLKELQEMGPAAAQEIHALSTLTESGLQEYADLFKEKTELIQEQAKMDIKPITIPIELDGVVEKMQSGMKTKAAVVAAMGTTVVSAFQGGITSRLDKILQTGGETMKAVAEGINAQSYMAQQEARKAIDECMMSIRKFQNEFRATGEYLMQGVGQGVADGKSGLVQSIVWTLEEAVSAAKSAMKINSPSKVWAGIGSYMAQGLGVGFAEQMRSVEKQISESIPIPIIEPPSMAAERIGEGVVNGVASVMQGSGMSGRVTIEVPVMLDGNELARAVADYMPQVSRQRG